MFDPTSPLVCTAPGRSRSCSLLLDYVLVLHKQWRDLVPSNHKTVGVSKTASFCNLCISLLVHDISFLASHTLRKGLKLYMDFESPWKLKQPYLSLGRISGFICSQRRRVKSLSIATYCHIANKIPGMLVA